MVKGAKYIDVVELSNRPKGTCVVETSSGIMDSSVETQLRESVRRLRSQQTHTLVTLMRKQCD